MSFQIIRPSVRGSADSPAISVKGLSIRLNSAASRAFIKSNSYVTVYNDALTRRVGLKFHKEAVPGSRKISKTSSNYTFSNSALSRGILNNVEVKGKELIFDEKTNLVTFKY